MIMINQHQHFYLNASRMKMRERERQIEDDEVSMRKTNIMYTRTRGPMLSLSEDILFFNIPKDKPDKQLPYTSNCAS